MIWRKPALQSAQEGSVAVETGIVISLVMMPLLLGIIEFTVAFWQFNTMSLAVAQAGRYVMVRCAQTTPCSTASTYCDTSCAQTRMQGILTSAAVCTTPTANQTCVSASLTTHNGTAGMSLTATYGYTLISLAGPFTITSGVWVPLN
jgi:Flp pilus assembly protein TadG